MNSRRLPLFIMISFLFLAVYWLRDKERMFQKKMLQTPTSSQNEKIKMQSYATSKKPPSKKVKIPENSKLNLQNMNLMAKVLRQSVQQARLKNTLDLLHVIKTRPTYFQDSNSSTGILHVVRTESSLPGTRYFHAQFFSDQKNEPFLQHMSFEIPPERESFRLAAQIVKENFKDLSPQPQMQKDGFILWRWKNGYNVWILRLGKDHLQGDPFNAYEPHDIGTVRIAVEMDVPHDHHDFE